MKYRFDKHGWFIGLGNGKRSTEVAPPSLSLSKVPGELRANFIGVEGREWEVWPYAVPPADPPETTPVPEKVAMVDFRIALYNAGLEATVAAYHAGLVNPEKSRVKIHWEYELELRRYKGVSQDLGLTQEQIDDLFIAAGT